MDEKLLEHVHDYMTARLRQARPSEQQAAAWEAFFPICDRIIARGLGRWRLSDADRCDCAQEVWEEVLDSLRDERPVPQWKRFEPWLGGVVRHKAIDALRHHDRHPTAVLTAELSCALLDDRSPDPALQYEREQLLRHIEALLQELSRRVSARSYRVFHARWFEGRSMAEIGGALGMTPAQARFRYHRVAKTLRHLLKRSLEV